MLSQRLRSPGILDATPCLHAGYRCCAACAFAHLYTSFLNWRHGEACAKDNNLYPVWGDDTIWKMPGQLCSRTEINRKQNVYGCQGKRGTDGGRGEQEPSHISSRTGLHKCVWPPIPVALAFITPE